MRLPRLRLKLWQFLGLVALTAIFLGGFQAHRMKQRSAEYRLMAYRFALEATFEKDQQESAEQIGEETLKQLKDSEKTWREILSFELKHRFRGIDDGIYARGRTEEIRRDPDIAETRNMIKGLQELSKQQSNELNESKNRHAKRAKYFTQLSQKYEEAALAPWVPVEPDPPEPRF